jgi:hypothetical protein
LDGKVTITSTRTFRPEVGRLWLRRAFREWPPCRRRWIDLAQGRMRSGGDDAALPAADSIASDGGLLYIPPVDRELGPARDGLVEALARRGVPLLVQLASDEPLPPAGAPPETLVVDLLEALLTRRLEDLDAVPAGAVALWPLLPALTDDAALWDDGCRRLAAAGASCVQATVPELSAADRRELAGGESEGPLFSRLFHGRADGERRFAAAAAAHGLDAFFRRRAPRSDRRARNEALSELLALGAELWLRLGRGEVQGQELFRASRWVEDTAVDVRALAAEGNLEIVEALRDPAARIVGEWARAGASATVETWLAEYVSVPPGT